MKNAKKTAQKTIYKLTLVVNKKELKKHQKDEHFKGTERDFVVALIEGGFDPVEINLLITDVENR